MAKFTITEKLTLQSTRAPSAVIDARDLSAAKRAATRGQMFKFTVLEVADESGRVLAWKDKKGRWN